MTICLIQHLWHLLINENTLLLAILLLGTVQWDWVGFWICAGWKEILGGGVEADDQTVLSWSTVMQYYNVQWTSDVRERVLEWQNEREYLIVMGYILLNELQNVFKWLSQCSR